MVLRIILTAAALLSLAGVASADDVPVGSYMCSTEQKAGVAQELLEGAEPPKAFTSTQVNRFRIVISAAGKNAGGAKYRIVEAPYSGRERDKSHWQTASSVLHGAYLGDGWKFTGTADQAFLRLDIANPESGWLWFYHAGFEHADDYHMNLSVRVGTCAPAPGIRQ